MSAPGPGYYAMLYRWRINPGHEKAFAAAWVEVTERLLDAGSLGSRLHRGDDGCWYGYAQWPSDEVRAAAFAENLASGASAAMQAAIAETQPPIQLTPVADYLQ